MPTEIFSLDEFQVALASAIEPLHITYTNVVAGEHVCEIMVKQFPRDSVWVYVNSSVRSDTGMAADSGQDSIRGWIVDGLGNPLGNKTQRWVTRVPGWQERLKGMMEKLLTMANSIAYCNTCESLERVFVVKKDGANKGRLFKKCQCDNSFQWLDDFEQTDEAEEIPSCPSCGSRMIKRNGRYGEFWGCSTYPKCKATRSVGDEHVNGSSDNGSSTSANASRTPTAKHKAFTPSKYQQAIFKHVQRWFDPEVNSAEMSNTLVINALAGSGKTTTGKHLINQLPRNVRGVCVAFNRHIAKELQRVMPPNVKATTNHSLGFAACRQALNLTGGAVKSDKVKIILNQFIDLKTNPGIYSPVNQLVSLVKSTLMSPDAASLDYLCEFYGIELNGNRDLVYECVTYVVKRSMEMTSIIDYDDMVWLPVILDLPCDKYDFIFVDEAQDLNACDLELISKHAHDNTKFVFVGDRYQSMYGFRGADVESIPNIIQRFNAAELPLSITYRSPKSVVGMVNEKFPEIGLEAAEWAEEGVIRYIRKEYIVQETLSGDMVLCRINAPLVRPCMALIRNGRKAVIRGRDIGKGLIRLVEKMKADNVMDLVQRLNEYMQNEYVKLLEADKKREAEALSDKVETIIALTDGCAAIAPMYDVISRIERVFSDEVEGVVFSSVHKAKGLEADNIFILKPELMPHPMAEQDWEQQQERNIEYVALTRCKGTLTFVHGN